MSFSHFWQILKDYHSNLIWEPESKMKPAAYSPSCATSESCTCKTKCTVSVNMKYTFLCHFILTCKSPPHLDQGRNKVKHVFCCLSSVFHPRSFHTQDKSATNIATWYKMPLSLHTRWWRPVLLSSEENEDKCSIFSLRSVLRACTIPWIYDKTLTDIVT